MTSLMKVGIYSRVLTFVCQKSFGSLIVLHTCTCKITRYVAMAWFDCGTGDERAQAFVQDYLVGGCDHINLKAILQCGFMH